MAQFVAKSLGLSSLPLVVLKHPLAGIGEDAAKAKGEAIVEQVKHVLTQPRESLESEYMGKEYPLSTGVCPMTKPGL